MSNIFKNYNIDPNDKTVGQKITLEEEKQLFLDARSENKKISEQAKNQIVKQYIKLVIYTIRSRYPSYWKDHCYNLVQAGLQGVIYAAVKGINLDKEDNASYVTKLTTWIINKTFMYISKEVHQKETHIVSDEKKINEAKVRLSKKGNNNPSVVDIALESGMKSIKVQKILKGMELGVCVSIEESKRPADESLISDPEEIYGNKEERETLRTAINKILTKEERVVIILKNGLYGFKKKNNVEIRDIIGATTADVSALEHSAMDKLRLHPALRAYYNSGNALSESEFECETAIVPSRSAQMMMNDIFAEIKDYEF